MPPKLIIDRPAPSKVYNTIINILDLLSGVKWGYTKGNRRIKYVTSREIPARIGILWGKKYESLCTRLDIEICNKSPSAFADETVWRETLVEELSDSLSDWIRDRHSIDLVVQNRILSRVPSGEFAILASFARIQNSKWVDGRPVNRWLDECSDIIY